ncbi:hypothetical protein AMS68_007788 [Peltaster fructicola]|uniref:Uncharacterized protein n=1 Tax=Peltaster fructicola TaxID=286661 RepID=A0A6H0Y5R4_9PEZI|nr:hypothetical protein AMS68_007788 [Peltaster fructicola]
MEAPGIGLSLEMAHATVAVRHHNGSYQNIASVETDLRYNEKMADLIHAGRGREFDNSTIEVLGNTVRQLRLAVENAGIDVTAAAITLPDPIYLQYDEAAAILDYATIRNVMYDPVETEGIATRFSLPGLCAISAAYAGHGMGLCTDYLDVHACEEQEACLPNHHVLQIDLSSGSLAGTTWRFAQTYWSPVIVDTFVNTSLGTNAIQHTPREQGYWQAVCQAIRGLLTSFLPNKIDYLILTGTSAHVFVHPLKAAMREALLDAGYQINVQSGRQIDQVLHVDHVVHEPLWVTARGAAEIAKRRLEGPFLCRYDNRSEEQRRPLRERIKEWEADGLTELHF